MSEQTMMSFIEAKILSKALDSEINQLDGAWDIGIANLAEYVIQKGLVEQLGQLCINGPVEDGDIISKTKRAYLFDLKLITRVMHHGEWGYTAANYMGGFVLKACFSSLEIYQEYVKSRLK